MLKILIFSGSARQGNYTKHVATFVQQTINKNPELKSEVVSPSSLQLDFNDEGTQANKKYPQLTEQVQAADAFIIVAPEYNHGYSGSLKYMLDMHYKEYKHKPVGFVGVSEGPWGGTRVIERLIGLMKTMSLSTIKTDVNVTNVRKEIENGKFKDPATWEKRVNQMLDELVWLAKVLKQGREASTTPSQD